MFYYIEPEVPGGFGKNTIVDTTTHPPLVTQLHYKFDGWQGDDLLTSFPCYIASESLARALDLKNLTGYSLAALEISKSEKFQELSPNKDLPEFKWLKVNGEACKDDFGMSEDHRLIVSDEALQILKKNKIDQAVIQEAK